MRINGEAVTPIVIHFEQLAGLSGSAPSCTADGEKRADARFRWRKIMSDFKRKSARMASSILLTSGSFFAFTAAAPAQDDIGVLLAPADSVVFEATQSEPVTGPITGQPISLPYANVLPLPEGPIGDPARTYIITRAGGVPWAAEW